MAGIVLETPSRIWRRIQEIEDEEMPSLPSLPAIEDSREQPSSASVLTDLSVESNPLTSTPATFKSSNTMTTIRPPGSTGSTARFAQSIASRSSKSSMGPMSVSRANSMRFGQKHEDTFDVSSIPGLPGVLARDQLGDVEIRGGNQESHIDIHSVSDEHLPSAGVDTDHDHDLDLSDALQPVSRANSPSPEMPGMAPMRGKYDYSVSLKSEPQPSPFDRLRNVSFRRPLSRNTRTPSLTSTSTPSPSSSTSSQPTPQSSRSTQRQNAITSHAPSPTRIPLPRSATASPMPRPGTTATPTGARGIPLPRSRTSSPTGLPRHMVPDQDHTVHTVISESEDAAPTSLPVPPSPSREQQIEDFTVGSDIQTTDAEQEREPTFSSEEATREGGAALRYQSLSPAQSQLSSPMQSTLMTPTPAFPPRAASLRARFNLNPISEAAQSTTPADQPNVISRVGPSIQSGSEGGQGSVWGAVRGNNMQSGGIPATPATAHKRSFLLSVINSTARPRLKFSTPHPHQSGVPDTPASVAEESTQADETVTGADADTAVAQRTAFAGATPRAAPIRPTARRLSHPLAQAWTARSLTSSSTPSPAQESPQLEGASFVSTASSQDLAIHNIRANASFDPVIGLGERGHGVSRFNAGKLNTYLHGLNRRLEEENEELVGRLRTYEERFGTLADTQGGSASDSGDASDARKQRRSSGRRVSAGPAGLGEIAEGWEEEKAALEEIIEELKAEVEESNREKEDVLRQKADILVHADEALKQKEDLERALEEEREERIRDKGRWKERMEEAQQGVAGLIDGLEQQRQDAERRIHVAEKEKAQTIKDVERRLAEVVIERDILAERLEKAERGRDVINEVHVANERVEKVLGDFKNANVQIKELEEEVIRADERIDVLESDLREEKKLVSELECELQVKSDELSQTLARINSLDSSLKTVNAQVETLNRETVQYEADAAAAVEHIESLSEQLAAYSEKLEASTAALDEERQKSSQLEDEADRASELAKQMGEAVEAAQAKLRTDEEQVTSLKVKIASLERELDRSRSHIGTSQYAPDAEVQAQIDALEAELDEANKEVARLNVLLSHSPARKAMEKAKDTKIEMLEQERDDLLERIKSLRTNSFFIATPGKTPGSKLSPLHRHILSMSFKSPKTPGGPLPDLSWLQSTMHDATISPLVAEIERLQQELERANELIDTKLDRLEDGGVDVISLTAQLEDAKAKIMALEEEVSRLQRKEERRSRRLEKLRCQKCHMKVDTKALEQKLMADESSILSDSSMALEPPTPTTRTGERLRQDLDAVNSQLTSMKKQWEEERRRLLGDNATLRDAAKRLDAEIRQAKSETEKTKTGMQGELDRAKRVVDELETALKEERSRLRSLSTEQTDAQRHKDEVAFQLRRAESDMAEIRDQLQKIKQENRELETELRSNANADQKARLLEAKVVENAETIEQLRKERSLLISDHKGLQRQFTQISEQVSKLREEYASSQSSHDNRRHELDLHLLEIEDLRRALADRADQLEKVEAEKAKATTEKSEMSRNVTALEADLRRVKREAEAFGRDLKALRAQKDKLEEERVKTERVQKQSQTEIRLLKDEATEQREKALALQKRLKEHVCEADSQQLDSLRLRHKEECKGLIIQIRYLKAKWTRENALRSDLCNQKRYLLVLLARCDRTEQKILAAIAKIGYPAVPQIPLSITKKPKSFRSVVHSVIFLLRARRASDGWREQLAAKEAIAAAYQEVRKRKPPVQSDV